MNVELRWEIVLSLVYESGIFKFPFRGALVPVGSCRHEPIKPVIESEMKCIVRFGMLALSNR